MSIYPKQSKPVQSSWIKTLLFVMSVSGLCMPTANSQCSAVDAYTATVNTGNQSTFNGRLGLNFTVNSPIQITRLGAYDSDQDGLNRSITVGIVNAAGSTVVVPEVFTGTGDLLVGQYRWRNLATPVTLSPGNYQVVALNYGTGEPNGNTNIGGTAVTTNVGSGYVTYGSSPFEFDNTFGLATQPFATIGGFHAGNFTFRSIQPLLTTNINSTTITSNNDGNDDLGSFAVCSGVANNLSMGVFSVSNGSGANIKVFQEIVLNNVNLSGAWCNGIVTPSCSAVPSAFNGAVNTATLVNPSLTGTVTLRFYAFVDLDNDNIVDVGECTGDRLVYTATVNTNPTTIISSVPTEACILTNVQMNGNPTGGASPYTHLWSGAGATFLNNTNTVNPIFNHNTIGAYVLQYTVTDNNGCIGTDDITVTLRDVGLPDISCPTSPVEMTTDPDRCSAVVCFPVSAMDLCPVNLPTTLSGHTYMGTLNNHTYFHSNTSMTWEQANAAAVALGGHLVSITSATEQTFLSNFIPNGLTSTFWIGLRYSPSLDLFKWTTGEPVVYTNWGPSQPGLFNGDYVYHFDAIIGALRGWYDSPSVLNRRYIIEFEGFPVQLISGLPSGSIFPVGNTTVTYRATDSAGNTDQCSFVVTVTDGQVPEIQCPDDITIQLDPLECEAEATFEPELDDNCPGVSFNYLTDLESGDLFPVGVNVVTLEAEDAEGNVSPSCSFNVNILDYENPELACINVQLSLDGDCEGTLRPTDVLTGWRGPGGEVLLGCLDLYTINVKGPNGQNLGATLGFEQLKKTLKYTITNTNGFSCWGEVTVEDKIAPTITCRDLTVDCLTDLATLPLPIANDNCRARAVKVNEVHQRLDCDPNLIGRVTITWKAIDDAGNESATCTQVINQRRSSGAGILAPPVNPKLKCSDNFKKDDKGQGFPDPSVTGIPTFGGKPIFPTSQLNMLYCNAVIDYTDKLIINTPCKKMISRRWEIIEWWCGSTNILFVATQNIEIIDDVAPVIPPVNDLTLSTSSRSCDVNFDFPKLTVTDNCNAIYKVYINVEDSEGNPIGFVDANGGTLVLPVGVNTVTYSALDICSNMSTMSYDITVRDNTDPIALCDQFNSVSIRPNGITEISAASIDDGSFDECSSVELKIQKMTKDLCNTNFHIGWHDKVTFCCEDVNKSVMILLQVTDKGRNQNTCMVSVNIQDKIAPSIACPNDLTISDCNFTFDPANLAGNFDTIKINDNCSQNVFLTDRIVDERNQCGVGNITRTGSIPLGNGQNAVCQQIITFENNDPFFINRNNALDPNDDVIWPKNYTATGQCSFSGLLPETLPDSSSFPKFTEDACDLVGMKYDDQVFRFTTNGACYKIIRTWSIIDWCQVDRNGDNLKWTFEQEIKVMDNNAPVLSIPLSTVVIKSAKCSSGNVTLSASAVDCTPAADLRWSYIITQGNQVIAEGDTNVVIDEFDLGTYNIHFEVEDKCGNISEGSYNFRVETTKAPNVVCKQGLAAPLILMDADNNGTGDTPLVVLSPSFFDNKSDHACGYDIRLSFSQVLSDTVVRFDCGDVGRQDIQLWVTDENGNTSYCSTYIDIQANGLCNNVSGQLASISGRIATEHDDEIEDVIVDLKNSELTGVHTNQSGLFVYPSMPVGREYSVLPSKDGDDMNGISTLDLVMIQRHILGIETIKTPFSLIAADINKSNSISSADMVEVRKLILGLIPGFTNNTSWRFIDAAYTFPEPNNPWATPFPERYEINGLNQNMDINFIGVKIGDINGNVKANGVKDEFISPRSNVQLILEDREVFSGDKIVIPVYLEEMSLYLGMQAALQTNGVTITACKNGGQLLKADEVYLNDDLAILSLTAPEGLKIESDKALFYIEVEANRSGRLSDMLYFSENLNPEVYHDALFTTPMTLSWKAKKTGNMLVQHVSPNPWKTNTRILVELTEAQDVLFKIFDVNGRLIVNQTKQLSKGQNTIEIQSNDVNGPGVYMYELKGGTELFHGKMIHIE